MNPLAEVHYEVSTDDAVALQIRQMRRLPAARRTYWKGFLTLLFWALVLSVLGSVLLHRISLRAPGSITGHPLAYAFIFALTFGSVIMGQNPRKQRLAAERRIRRLVESGHYPAVTGACSIILDDDGITTVTEVCTIFFPWRSAEGVQRTPEAVYFDYCNCGVTRVPVRAFADGADLERFTNIAERCISERGRSEEAV